MKWFCALIFSLSFFSIAHAMKWKGRPGSTNITTAPTLCGADKKTVMAKLDAMAKGLTLVQDSDWKKTFDDCYGSDPSAKLFITGTYYVTAPRLNFSIDDMYSYRIPENLVWKTVRCTEAHRILGARKTDQERAKLLADKLDAIINGGTALNAKSNCHPLFGKDVSGDLNGLIDEAKTMRECMSGYIDMQNNYVAGLQSAIDKQECIGPAGPDDRTPPAPGHETVVY